MPGNARINAFISAGDTRLAGTDSGIFVSHDEGQSWHAAAGAAASSGRVVTFATLGQSVYAGTDRSGMLVSHNEAATRRVDAGFPSKNVRCLLQEQGKLYAGTDAEGVFLSSDRGGSWKQLTEGFPSLAQVFALTALKGKLFAALYSKGLYTWDDGNRRWSKTGPVSPLVLATIGDTLVAGHNPGGIYTSDDLGATWSKATLNAFGDLASSLPDRPGELSSDAPVWELASGAGRLFAGAASGIYYSEDNGRSWTRARIGLPEESPGVAFLVRREVILAATLVRTTQAR